jgi:hypothetical protein
LENESKDDFEFEGIVENVENWSLFLGGTFFAAFFRLFVGMRHDMKDFLASVCTVLTAAIFRVKKKGKEA